MNYFNLIIIFVKNNIMIALLILLPIVAVASFVIGKYSERLQWNKLIKLGRIPRPSNPNLNHKDYWANH
jgi:hypothetical protein